MRAAVVYFEDKYGKLLKEQSEAFAKGLEARGIRADVIDAKSFNSRLSVYQFIAFGTEPAGTFGGKLPAGFVEFLKKSGTMTSSRAFAFVCKKGFRPEKSLLALMSAMENEGLFIVSSDVFSSPDLALEIGKKVNIKSGL